MSRSPNESSCCEVFSCGTHVPPPHARLNGATGMLIGPLSVVLAVLFQSTWNFHKFSEFEPKFMKKFGDPAGGTVLPSRSDGYYMSFNIFNNGASFAGAKGCALDRTKLL